MAEWLVERGIGETRAALIEDGTIVEAALDLPGRLRVGTVAAGRLTSILVPRRRGIVTLAEGGEALIEPLPGHLTEGAALRVEITREALEESGRNKLPRCRHTDAPEGDGPDLEKRLHATGASIAILHPAAPDRLEQAGWSELLGQASTGSIPFAGGSLQMSLTPAMTLFDVDGALAPRELALAGAEAAGRAIRRLAIGGSIGIDLPTMPSREDRLAAAAALDAALPQPFERTAVNGFGFLQVVRRRERPSVPEILQTDPVAAAARALLRRAERSAGSGVRTLHAHPAVVHHFERKREWLEALGRRLGGAVALQPDPALAISGGHAHSQFP